MSGGNGAKGAKERTFDLDDLNGAVLVAETEELEVAVLRLLRLSVSVDLDAKEVSVRLPVDLALRAERNTSISSPFSARKGRTHVMNVEEVLGANRLPTGKRHEGNASRLVGDLGRPERDDVLAHGHRALLLLVRLGELLRRRALLLPLELLPLLVAQRTPLEIDNAINLDALLAEQAHRRHLVDRDLLAGRHASEELLVGAPLEHGPDDALLSLDSGVSDHGERSQKATGHDVPDGDLVPLVLVREERILRDLDRAGRPGDEVALERGEVDELDLGVGEAVEALEGGASPEGDSGAVHGGEEGTLRRPLGVGICPFLRLHGLAGEETGGKGERNALSARVRSPVDRKSVV